jgi:hypothetical protein
MGFLEEISIDLALCMSLEYLIFRSAYSKGDGARQDIFQSHNPSLQNPMQDETNIKPQVKELGLARSKSWITWAPKHMSQKLSQPLDVALLYRMIYSAR